MKKPFLSALLAVSLCLVATAPKFAAAVEGAPPASLPTSVTQDILDAKIKEVESAAGLADEAKAKLVELYRRASSNPSTYTMMASVLESSTR